MKDGTGNHMRAGQGALADALDSTRLCHGPRQEPGGGSMSMDIQEQHAPIAIRCDVKPGDIGYITHLHGILYAKEYELDCTFVFLWTFSELQAAAHLYRAVGFQKTEQKRHVTWGRLLTEERYDLPLQGTTEHARH